MRSDQIFEGKYLQRTGRICGPWLCRIFVEKKLVIKFKVVIIQCEGKVVKYGLARAGRVRVFKKNFADGVYDEV